MSRDEIRQDLLDQLERNGTVGGFYADLVEDYCRLLDTKNALLADVKERGAKVKILFTSGAVKEIRTNDSVLDALKVNGQMLKILDALGLDPAQTGGDADDSDSL